MYQTTVFTGSIFTVAEELTSFFKENGHSTAYALAICGNHGSDSQIESYKDILGNYQLKLGQEIYRPPLHFLVEGIPSSIILVGELLNLCFTSFAYEDNITIFVDKKLSPYDLQEM